MSRVHDALRRAEMGGMMPPEEPPAVAAEVVPVSPDLRPPDSGLNGTATAPAMAPQIMGAESLSRANQPQARAILQRLEIDRSYVMRDDGRDRLLR